MKAFKSLVTLASVLIFSTSVFAKGSVEYNESSQIFLVLDQALKDVRAGKAHLGGGDAATYEALKLAGFRVTKITATDMGSTINLQLEFKDEKGKILTDWQGVTSPSTFFLQAPSSVWKNMVQ